MTNGCKRMTTALAGVLATSVSDPLWTRCGGLRASRGNLSWQGLARRLLWRAACEL